MKGGMTIQEMLDRSSGAIFSPCRKYRYRLWRIWDFNKPTVMFIGLNPSKANEMDTDNTITRVIEFAKSWGYGGVYMMNLFAFVSTKPEKLKTCRDPVRDNDKHLIEVAKKCKMIVFCWGQFDVFGRDKKIEKMFPNAVALHINDDGSPRHPLYVSSQTRPIQYIYVR